MLEKDQMTVTIPSSPEDRKQLKTMLSEMVRCLDRQSLEAQSKKEIASEIKEKFQLPLKFSNKLAKTMFKHNFSDVKSEQEEFETLWEVLIENKKVEDDE